MLIQVIAVEYLRYLQFDRNFKDMKKRRERLGAMTMFWLDREVESLTHKDVSDFIQTMRERNCKPTYINAFLSILRAFLTFCKKSGLTVLNFKEIEFIPVPRKNVNYLNTEEVKDFFALLQGDSIIHSRDKAIFAVLFDTGMRIGECLSLKVSQLSEIMNGECSIIGKGGHERKVFFSWAKNFVAEYLERKPKEDTSEFLFTNCCHGLEYRYKPLQQEPFRKKLRKLRAEFGKFFTVHDMRRTAGTNWKLNGMDIYDVSKLLGHQSVHTTERYYLGTDWERLKVVHEKYAGY